MARDRRFVTEVIFEHMAGGEHVATVESIEKFLKSSGVEADILEIERLVHWYCGVRPDAWEHSEFASFYLVSLKWSCLGPIKT